MENLIFVVTHKEADIPKIYPYKSIGVGTKKDSLTTDWRDDTGDNIAEKNANYCELTAQYWVWKNCMEQYQFIGLCHYRRFFPKSIILRRSLLDNDTLIEYLKKADIILPARWYWNTSVYFYYFVYGHGKEKDLKYTRSVIARLYPEYLDAFNTILSGRSASYCNMFVMNKVLFDQYCTWLFRILGEVEKGTDLRGYSKEEARIYGYLSELLLNVWVLKNQLRIKYLPIYETEKSVKTVFKEDIKHFLRRLLPFYHRGNDIFRISGKTEDAGV